MSKIISKVWNFRRLTDNPVSLKWKQAHPHKRSKDELKRASEVRERERNMSETNLLRDSKRRSSNVRDHKVVGNKWIRGWRQAHKEANIDETEKQRCRASHCMQCQVLTFFFCVFTLSEKGEERGSGRRKEWLWSVKSRVFTKLKGERTALFTHFSWLLLEHWAYIWILKHLPVSSQ